MVRCRLGPAPREVGRIQCCCVSVLQLIPNANRYYADAPAVTIVGQPSAALADRLEKEEKARVAATVKKYGEDGLAKLAKEIEEAQAENDRPIPPELISKFKVPDVAGIEWIKVESARSSGVAQDGVPLENRVQQHVNQDGAQLPLFVQFDRELFQKTGAAADTDSSLIQTSHLTSFRCR